MSLDRYLQRGKVNGARKGLFTLSVTLAFNLASERASKQASKQASNKKLPSVRAARIWSKQLKKVGITYFSFVFRIYVGLGCA